MAFHVALNQWTLIRSREILRIFHPLLLVRIAINTEEVESVGNMYS
jgi:hypothetical protein